MTQALGRYEVVGLLGVGGMARVYAARDPQTGQDVALKRLLVPTPDHAARLAQEVRAQQSVEDPRVLPVLEVVELPEGPVLVLPWVRGPTLGGLLAVGLPEPQRLALFREVVEGVAAIHRAGLVHRDLKPSNVLLDCSGPRVVPRIADFGLAKLLQSGEWPSLTRTGEGLGTPVYQAPEQRADASRVTPAADVYALGVMLVELLTGKRPAGRHPGDSPWDELARSLLETDPARRPAGGSELLTRLPPTEPQSPELLEVCRAHIPALAGPSEELVALPGHLPSEPDPFVGRHEELEVLAQQVGASRLVSLVGAAGIGKTRLALRYAALWGERHPGGAWFCDLCEARSLDDIAAAVARTLEIPLGHGDPAVQVGHALAGRGRCLVILDNFEQVAEHAEATVGRWLARAEQLQLVVTTRQTLGLADETLFALDPLSPADAQALFLRRASRSYTPDAQERLAIGKLVELLDFLPLAIELAAARVKVMAPSAMLARIHQRFRLLSAPGRPDRHATLRAALDWSWDLLGPEEQQALAQLSVFQGGFDPRSAQVVLEREQSDALLSALVSRSWLRKLGKSTDRMGMLVSVAEYTAGKLVPEQRLPTEQRHGRYFAKFGTPEALRELERTDSARWWSLADELDNLVAATRRAVARGDTATALDALEGAWAVLERRGPFSTGQELASLVAAMPLTPAERLRVTLLQGAIQRQSGRGEEAIAHFEPGLKLAREQGDREREGRALAYLAAAYDTLGRTRETGSYQEQALQIFRELGERLSEGVALSNLGIVYHRLNEHSRAQALYEDALLIHREVGNRRSEGETVGNLGMLYAQLGRMDEALANQEQALRIFRELGHRTPEVLVLARLGNLHRALGRTAEARAYFEASIVLSQELGQRREVGVAEGNLGNLALEQGELAVGQAHCERALQIAREVHDERLEALAMGNVGVMMMEQGLHEQARPHLEGALARHREQGSRVQEAVLLNSLGRLYGKLGQRDAARAHYEQALVLQRAAGNRRSEAVVLANLAQEEEQLEKAVPLLQQALQITREVKHVRFEGIFLGMLGELQAAQGSLAEARASFERGAELLAAVPDRLELAKLLAQRALLEREAGEERLVLDLLRQIEALAVPPNPELDQRLAKLRG